MNVGVYHSITSLSSDITDIRILHAILQVESTSPSRGQALYPNNPITTSRQDFKQLALDLDLRHLVRSHNNHNTHPTIHLHTTTRVRMKSPRVLSV
jgi:hypothetical protein